MKLEKVILELHEVGELFWRVLPLTNQLVSFILSSTIISACRLIQPVAYHLGINKTAAEA